jgi:copper transport protein
MYDLPTRIKTGRRLAVLATLCVAAVVVVPGRASGHAIVEETAPRIDQVVQRSPARVTMNFNEPVEIAFGAIRVFDTRGRRVDAGDAEHLPGRPNAISVPLEPGLARGTYTVTWRVVSADGHPIEEAFVFHVRAPGENPQGIAAAILSGEGGAGPLEGALAGVGRWLGFASLLGLAGAAGFLVLVWRRSAQATVGRSRDVEVRFDLAWRRVLVWSWVGALVATVMLYVLQGAVAGDLPLSEALSADVLSALAGTRFGIVSLVRLGLLLVGAALWLGVRQRLSPGATSSVGAAATAAAVPGWALAAGFVLLVGLLSTPGLSGHAGTTPPAAVNVPADVLHMAGAAVWVGGLLLLVVGAFPATRGLAERDRVRTLAPVVSRFSDLALVAIAILVASGVFRAWTEVRALRALTGAPYGIVLLIKLAIFVPILAMGIVNNRWTKPRITRAAAEDAPDRAPLRALRRLVAAEVLLATAVLGVTAFLVNLPPARVEAGISGPFITDMRLGANNLNVLVDPNRVGLNEVHLTATEPSGAPLDVKEARVLFRMPSEGIGPLVGEGTKLAEGHFVAQGHQLSVAGEWELEIVMRVGRFDEERATVTVIVNG